MAQGFDGLGIDDPEGRCQFGGVVFHPRCDGPGALAIGQGGFDVAEVGAGNGFHRLFPYFFDFQGIVTFVIAVGYGFAADVFRVLLAHVEEQVVVEQDLFPFCLKDIPFRENLARIFAVQAQQVQDEAEAVALEGEVHGVDIDFPHADILFRLFAEIAVKIADRRLVADILEQFLFQGHPLFKGCPAVGRGCQGIAEGTVQPVQIVQAGRFQGQGAERAVIMLM